MYVCIYVYMYVYIVYMYVYMHACVMRTCVCVLYRIDLGALRGHFHWSCLEKLVIRTHVGSEHML